jgi:hypothetical protein
MSNDENENKNQFLKRIKKTNINQVNHQNWWIGS